MKGQGHSETIYLEILRVVHLTSRLSTTFLVEAYQLTVCH